MKRILVLAFLFVGVLSRAQTYRLINGNWLLNGKFKKTIIYTKNGQFSFKAAETYDSTIDLNNQYCIPPFSDAHTHNLDAGYNLKEMVKTYLNDGIFYVQVLGNYGSGAQQVRPALKNSGKIDVTYANGLLTATYGHGFYPYEPLAMGIYSPADQVKFIDSIKKSRIAENNAYYFFDSVAEVDSKWPLVMKYKPDHIKICLLDAAHYTEKRKAEKYDDYGLSPEVATYIVKKAHAEGLRVFAHVETVADAKLCAEIGVDVLAHLPGYGWNGDNKTKSIYCLQKKDIRWIKRSGLSIIPTYNITHVDEFTSSGTIIPHPENLPIVIDYKKTILRELYKSGVKIGIGSDYYGKTATIEVDSLVSNEVFTPAQLIDIWCRQSAQLIFPKRKLGEIREGFEASFIALKENPLLKFGKREIQFRMKNGKIITL